MSSSGDTVPYSHDGSFVQHYEKITSPACANSRISREVLHMSVLKKKGHFMATAGQISLTEVKWRTYEGTGMSVTRE